MLLYCHEVIKVNVEEFGKYIKKLREEKGYSIRELEKHSGVSNAYLSQIENGKRGIPKPEILKKLYGPLDVDYDTLMEKAGYISPEVRTSLMPETQHLLNHHPAISDLVSNAYHIFMATITDKDGRVKKDYLKVLRDGMVERNPELADKEEEIYKLISSSDFYESMFDSLTFSEKIEALNSLISDFVAVGIDPNEVFHVNEEPVEYHASPLIKVPVLGYIAAGAPILADDHIEEWTEIPNMWNLKPGKAIVLKVKGDSMIGSRIYEGDKVVVKLQSDVENGEIAVVNINGDEATLKRVKKTEDGQVILYPDNPKYSPTFITNENSRVIGKVVQVMFEPRRM